MDRANRRGIPRLTKQGWLIAALVLAAAGYVAGANQADLGPGLLFGAWLAGAVLLTHRLRLARRIQPPRSGQGLAILAAFLMIATVGTQLHAWISG